MAKNNELVIKINGDIKQFNKKLKLAQQSTSDLQDKFNSIAKTGAVAFAAATAGLVGFISQAAKIELINQQFEVLTGSVSKAKKLMKELQEFSAKTPFQLDGIAKAGKQLLAFGFEVEDIKDKLQTIGDVAAATGQPIQDISLIFGQVAAAGKLTGERFLQLQERAVPLGAALAKSMKVPESAVKDLISAGKIGFPEFEEAFTSMAKEGGIAFEGMVKQSKTLTGVLSTLKDNFSLTAAEIGQHLLPAAKALAIALIDVLQTIKKNKELTIWIAKLTAAAAGIALLVTSVGVLGVAFLKLQAIMIALGGVTAALTTGFRILVGATGIGLIIVAITLLIVHFDKVKAAAVATFVGMTEVVKKQVNIMSNLLGGLGEILVGMISYDFDKVLSGFRTIGSAAIDTIDNIKDAPAGIADAYMEEIEKIKALEEEEANRKKEKKELAKEDKGIEKEEGLEGLILDQETIESMEKAHQERIKAIKDGSRKDDTTAYAEYLKEQEKLAKKNRDQFLIDEIKFGTNFAKVREFFRSTEFKGTSKALGDLSSLTRSSNKTLFAIGKASAIANATVNTAQHVTETLAAYPWPFSIAPAIAAGVAGAVQIGTIASQTLRAEKGFSGGGSKFDEPLISTFTPREVVIPEQFSDGIKKGDYALTSANEQQQNNGMTEVSITVDYASEEAARIVTVQNNEDEALGVSRSVA